MKLNHKLELMDQFDDAAFALMMDEYAEAEGERLRAEFEEAMRSGTAPACPPELDEKCRKQIKRHFGKQRRSAYAGLARRVAGRAAACLLIALGISAALVMSVEAIRTPFWQYVTREFGKETVFNFGLPADSGGQLVDPLSMDDPVFCFIPEGYRTEDFDVKNGRINSRYEDEEGHFIRFWMDFYSDDGMADIVESEYNYYIDLMGHRAEVYTNGMFPEEEQFIGIHWHDHDIETQYGVVANGMDLTELHIFCENIIRCFQKATIDRPAVVPDALEGVVPEGYENLYSESMQGLISMLYMQGEKRINFSVNIADGEMVTFVENSVVTEGVVAGFEATHMQGQDEIGTLWYDEERNLVFYCYTGYIQEADHLRLCEYLAEYYKNVTLPMVSTVIWE